MIGKTFKVIYNLSYMLDHIIYFEPYHLMHLKQCIQIIFNSIISSNFIRILGFEAHILLQVTFKLTRSSSKLIYEKSIAGYPYNLDFDYGALSQLQHFSINNLGDPFIESNYGVHSRQFEVGVLDWFARLWELEKNEYWGYITNCGTEGNLHGILVGLVSAKFISFNIFSL